MKITNVIALVALSSLALIAAETPAEGTKSASGSTAGSLKGSKGKGGKGSGGGKRKVEIKTKSNFGNAGGKIEVCPSGDCAKGQAIRLAMGRLEEFNGTAVTGRANKFKQNEYAWTPLTESIVNGTPMWTTGFESTLNVGSQKTGFTQVPFNMSVAIYGDNGTAMNGDQVIQVPAGAMKFTVSMGAWPFKATTNTLRFGVTIESQGKDGTARGKSGVKKEKSKDAAKMERVDLGEGMFMDAPDVAVLDGAEKAITSSVDASAEGEFVELIWEFPAFTKTLYYDPVVGSTDSSAQPVVTEEATSGSGSSTPAPTTAAPTTAPTTAPTPKPSAASTVSIVSAAAMATGALLAYFF